MREVAKSLTLFFIKNNEAAFRGNLAINPIIGKKLLSIA